MSVATWNLFSVILFCSIWVTSSKLICPLAWNRNESLPEGVDMDAECPHGTLLHLFDVTIPNNPTWVQSICVVYGVLPFIVVGLAVFECIVQACRHGGIGTREFSFLGFILFIVVTNEYILKTIAKQPRPEWSCNFSCGFPSGHSTMAMGFFILQWLDASFRVMPKIPMDLHSAELEENFLEGRDESFLGFTPHEWRIVGTRIPTLIPMSNADVIDSFDFVMFTSFWAILLVPVPFSRVVLNDHTAEQIMWGAVIGTWDAVVWFTVVRKVFQSRNNHRLGKRIGCIFVHNYPLARFEAISKCCRLIAKAESEGANLNKNVKLLQKLANMYNELGWYVCQIRRHRSRTFAFDEETSFKQREEETLKKWRSKLRRRLNSCSAISLEKISWCSESVAAGGTSLSVTESNVDLSSYAPSRMSQLENLEMQQHRSPGGYRHGIPP